MGEHLGMGFVADLLHDDLAGGDQLDVLDLAASVEELGAQGWTHFHSAGLGLLVVLAAGEYAGHTLY